MSSTEMEVVTVNLEIKDAAVDQAGFGTAMIAARHTFWTETVRTFATADELTALGVPTTHIIYKQARALKSQKPSPETFKIGKRADVAANKTFEQDLDAIQTFDPNWYGLLTDATTKADVLAAASWALTQRVLHLATLADVDNVAPATTGTDNSIAAALKTAGMVNTVVLYHGVPDQAPAAAWTGCMFPKAPGAATWANKSLAGVDKSSLNTTQRGGLKSRNANYYIDIKGIGFTLPGVTSSGRFIDIQVGMDWFQTRLEERIVGVFANNDSVQYTDKGIEIFRTQTEAQILEGINAKVIDGDQDWGVSVPLVKNANAQDKIARLLPNVKFSFVLQGAVHKVRFNGTALIAL